MFSNNESFPSVLSFHYSRSCPSAGKASQQMMRGEKKKKWHQREQRKRWWPFFLDKGRLLAPSACIPRGGPWWQRHWWSIASHEKAINLIKKEVLTWEQGQKDQACDKSKNKGQCQCFQLWAFLENLWKPGGQIIEVCPIRPWSFNFIYRASFHEKNVLVGNTDFSLLLHKISGNPIDNKICIVAVSFPTALPFSPIGICIYHAWTTQVLDVL